MATEIIKLSIALFCVWGFVYLCYRDYRLDLFREEIFIVRCELFEYAAYGGVAFNNPAYLVLRNFMNRTIRYAHVFTFARFIIAFVLSARHPEITAHSTIEWKEALANIESEEVRKDLTAFHSRVIFAIGGQLLKRSVLLSSVILCLSVAAKLLGSGTRAEDMIKGEDIEKFESQVMEVEEHDTRLKPAYA